VEKGGALMKHEWRVTIERVKGSYEAKAVNPRGDEIMIQRETARGAMTRLTEVLVRVVEDVEANG
jgi:hypothetical protein